MRFASVRELSSSTSHLLKEVEKNDAVVITKFGKPRYLLMGIHEDELEDFILARYLNLEKEFEKGRKELAEGKTRSLASLLKRR